MLKTNKQKTFKETASRLLVLWANQTDGEKLLWQKRISPKAKEIYGKAYKDQILF